MSRRQSARRAAPITDDDATIAAALEDVSIPTLMLSLVHMTGDPSLIRGDAEAAGPVPQRGAGLHVGARQGRGAPHRARRHPRVPRRRLPAARRRRAPELIREMMSWLVCEDVPDEYVPMMLEEMELDGARRRAGSRSPPTPTARARLPGRRHRLRAVGPARRHPAAGGRHPVHDHREEPRRRRHLVRELVSRLPRRRRQPLLLLLVRAERPVDRVLRAAARAPVVLRRRDASATASSAHIRWNTEVVAARLGRRHGALATSTCAAPTARRRRSPPRAVISAVGQLNRPNLPDIPGRRRLRGRVVPLGALGPLASTTAASASRSSAPARAASRSCRRSPATSPSSPCSSAPRSGCSRTRTTTRRSGPACSGRCAISRSTGAGIASCCSGRAATAGSRPRGSIRTGRTRTAPSARRTT